MITKLGMAMDRAELAYTMIVDLVCSRFSRINYLEIGVFSGDTMLGIVNEIKLSGKEWTSVGVDVSGWSYVHDMKRFMGMFPDIILYPSGMSCATPPSIGQSFMFQCGSENLLKDWKEQFQLVLIDGCHEYDCCLRDFELVEALVPKGGIVMFHDSNPEVQGQPQVHQGKGIEVLKVLHDTGLWNGFRPGWKHFIDISALAWTSVYEKI